MAKNIHSITIVALLILLAGNASGVNPPGRQDSTAIVNEFTRALPLPVVADGTYAGYISPDADIVRLQPEDYDAAKYKLAIRITDVRIDGRRAVVEAAQYPLQDGGVCIKWNLKKKRGKWVTVDKHSENSVILYD